MIRCSSCGFQNADQASSCSKCGHLLDAAETLSGLQTIPGGGVIAQSLSGRYKIVRQIGSGGMGMVYLASDTELDDMSVAIKILPPLLARNQRAVDNLRREAKTALNLTHPNICRLHSFQTDRDISYLVMEFIDGHDLQHKLTQKPQFSVEETIDIFTQIAAGLDYAHFQGVMHRDIKPANIIISRQGQAKLADFGIARELKNAITRLTGQNTSGTLLYMPPEQLRGEHTNQQSDIYAFAVAMYECIAGHPPFYQGAIEYQVLNEPPAPIQSLNTRQNDALLKALHKQSEKRQSSARQLLLEFGVSAGALQWQVSPQDEKQTRDAKRQPRKKRYTAAILMAITVLAIIAAVVAGVFISKQKTTLPGSPVPQLLPKAQPATPESSTPRAPTISAVPSVPSVSAKPATPAATTVVNAAALPAVEHVPAEADATDKPATEIADLPRKTDTAVLEDIPQPQSQSQLQPQLQAHASLIVPNDYPTIAAAIEAAKAGTTILVLPGVYAGPITLKDDIIIQGQEKGVTIQNTPDQGPVITAENCHKSLVTNITVAHLGLQEHAAKADAKKHTPPTPPGILIVDSSIEIAKCRVFEAAGAGIAIKGKGNTTIRDCLLQLNGGEGIVVTGKKSSPILQDNSCFGNTLDGIRFENAASGFARNNLCKINAQCGLCVSGKGTRVVVTQNTAAENSVHGILFEQGATGAITKNNCTNNLWQGIAVFGITTAPEITQNICCSNRRHGICFGKGTTSTATENTCSSNVESGIAVFQSGTNPTLKQNTCTNNQHHGIFIGDGAAGTIEQNYCHSNGLSGIVAAGANTTPLLRRNECNNNSSWGITYGQGAKPNIVLNNTAANNGQGQIKQ